MQISLFNFYLIFQLTRSQLVWDPYPILEVNLNGNNSWEMNMTSTDQLAFRVQNTVTKYCYVKIKLRQQDPSFLLIADYNKFPNHSLIRNYKQGEKIDRISQLENRRTRFLKLKSGIGNIYIFTRTQNIKNQFTISISGSNDEQCDNDCSKQGICQNDGCICNNSFIGNDCNQIANELFAGFSQNLEIQQQFNFFYIDLSTFKEQTLRFDFHFAFQVAEFNQICQKCFNLIIYRSRALVRQMEEETSIYQNIQDGTLTIAFKVPQNLSVNQQFLWFAIEKDSNLSNTVLLQMDIQTDDKIINEIIDKDNFNSGDDDDNINGTNKLLYTIIPSVAGSIIVISIIIWCIKKKRNQAADGRSLPAKLPQQPNIQPQQPNIPPPQSQAEQCAICLEDLNMRNKAVVAISCNHQFHLQCIQSWGNQQGSRNGCPSCRRPFNLNEIE